MMSCTRGNVVSSSDLLRSNAESLPGLMFATRSSRRAAGFAPRRSRRARKVLYPPHGRKYLPRQEKDPAKRWLLLFAGITLLQILAEAPEPGERSLREQLPCAPALPLAAANSSREDRAVSQALPTTLSPAAGLQALRQASADVPRQARRQAHSFCRQRLGSAAQ